MFFLHTHDRRMMGRCLELARGGLGWVAPNPLVGCVVVKSGRVIGEGFHAVVGCPHAEVEALRACSTSPQGAMLYVNLEPCNHHGKTPPCTDAIIAAGIRRVVVGMVDPNPGVRGQGIARLRQAGIRVTVGVRESECRGLNRIFIHWVTTRTPYVAAKVAVSSDYKIAAAPGVRTQITGADAERKVHALRQQYDAILVGVGTVLADDPELSVRHYPHRPRDPCRIILDSTLNIPFEARVLRDGNVLVATTAAADPGKLARLRSANIPVLVANTAGTRVDLAEVLSWCAAHAITGLLVEGGRQVLDSFVHASLIQRWYIGVAPFTLGHGGLAALSDLTPLERCLSHATGQRCGQDMFYDCPVAHA